MTFRRPRRRTVRWREAGGDGIEHLTVAPADGEIVARGVIVGGRGGTPYGIDYTIICGPDWTVRVLELGTTDGMALSLSSDGAGTWTNHDGRPLRDLDGCIDVDLAGSAFTNTLPIRRTDWELRTGSVLFTMLYIPFDSFVPTKDGQVYTALEGGRRFRYEAADRGFGAVLPVDSDGLVLDHPDLFHRVKDL